MADIEASKKPNRADKIDIDTSRTLPKWLRHLSTGVCSAFDCQVLHNSATGKLTFIGVGSDAHVAAYTYAYLERTIRKICRAYMKNNASDIIAAKN